MLAELGLHQADAPKIAKALGVSERTIWRWIATDAPKTARLSLWWLSRAGHSVWDCEMEARTTLAIQHSDALWREISRLRTQLAMMTRDTVGPAHRMSCANDSQAYARA